MIKKNPNRVLSKRLMYKKLDQGPEAKTIWGHNIPEILTLINGWLVYIYGFSLAEIMLEFVPKWKVIEGHAKETRPDIMHGAMQEATQEKIKEIKERLEGLNIKKMKDGKGRNSELLWPDQYQKITWCIKGTYKPPNRILRTKNNF